MTLERAPATQKTTQLGWDVGTAYELFVSLHVLHTPEKYDLRASWAAKILARIPTAERTFLGEIAPFLEFPLRWLYELPKPKNAITVLYALQQTPPAQRGKTALGGHHHAPAVDSRLLEIAERRRWDKNDLTVLVPEMCAETDSEGEQQLIKFLNWWVRPDDFGELMYAGLQAYYEAFFEQEEQRLGPVLQAGLERAKELSNRLSIRELISELSQGVQFTEDLGDELILVPTFWMTPLVSLSDIGGGRKLLLFGARPGNMSAIPGEPVPDAVLIALKALADPTRLKILNYISQQEMTPSELARRLNLRAPTVTHHLKELRLAGLVNLTVHGQEKLYRARLGALDSIHSNLKSFLRGK